ncbi:MULTISPECIES: hypothetical protein [Streptomyces]|uniref:hypothetical protein n=1 Tax=Streptomyces griseus TaxID=1911 RepID=UPI003797CCDD
MDATVAGLVGALGGAALGAAGAWGAALIAFRAARYQADRQADAQQQQWLRQVRRETYKSFLQAAETCTKQMSNIIPLRGQLLTAEGRAATGPQRIATGQALRTFKEALADLNLEAPPEIRERAAELSREYWHLTTFTAWDPLIPGEEESVLREDFERVDRASRLTDEIRALFRQSLTHPR